MKDDSEKTEVKQKIDKRKTMPHLFQPGQSGNPAGKPAGIRHMSTLLKESLQQLVRLKDKDGNERDITVERAIVEVLQKMAVKGDLRAIREVLDRIDGKPLQAVDVTSNGEKVMVMPQELINKNQTGKSVESS